MPRDENFSNWRRQANNSLNTRNVQPAIKTFRGDPELAAGYLPLANVLLGDLVHRLALGGIEQGARQVKLADGTLIKVLVNSGIYSIFIDSTSYSVVLGRSVFLVFENGMMTIRTLDNLNTPSIVEGALFYEYSTGDYLVSYFTGIGTVTGKEGGTDHFYLQDRVYYTIRYFLPQPSAVRARIPKTKTTLASYLYHVDRIANGANPSRKSLFDLLNSEGNLSFLTPAITTGSNYTGLMRLAVQTWLGVGRPPGTALYLTIDGDPFVVEAVDGVCPHERIEPFKDGLIYTTDYTFWWVRIAGATVSFVKMATDKATDFAKQVLASSTLSEEDRRKYLMFLIAGLRKDAADITVSYEPSGLTNVVGDGRAPLYFGWHYNYATPWKASIVTIRECTADEISDKGGWFRTATLATISFAFDENGVPYIGSVDIPVQDIWFNLPTIHSLYYPLHRFWCALTTPSGTGNLPMVNDPDRFIPLYCFYLQETNELEVIEYWFEETQLTQPNYNLYWHVCGFGPPYEEKVSDWWKRDRYGGYRARTNNLVVHSKTESGYYVELLQYPVPTKTTVNTSIIYTEPRQYSCGPGMLNGDGGFLDWLHGNGYYDNYSPIGTVTSRYGTIYQDYRKADVSYEGIYISCVIPVYDAEACFLAHLERTYYYPSIRFIFYEADPSVQGTIVEQNYFGMKVREESTAEWIDVEFDETWCNGDPPQGSGGYETKTVVIPEEEVLGGPTKVVSSRGIFDSSLAQDGWIPCFGSSWVQPCDVGCVAAATFAFTGGGIYRDLDGNESGYRVIGGYDEDTWGILSTRWIGDA